MENSKLTFSKERIAHLSNSQMKNVLGGEAASSNSTVHSFTCSWCLRISGQYKKGKEVTLNR